MESNFDVVVCGGGTAGVAAALASARSGARTVVIERLGTLGGTQTGGWVTPMMPNYLGDFKLNRGINLDLIAAEPQAPPERERIPHADVWYDPCALALAMDRLVEEAGVRCLFDATLCGVDATDGQVRAVEVVTRAGLSRIEGKCFVDCTGDGEVSFLAGAEIMSGNEDGEHQPMTLRFAMANVNIEEARAAHGPMWRVNSGSYLEAGYGEAKDGYLSERIWSAVDEGMLKQDDLGYFQIFTMNGRPGEFAFNCPRIAGLDPLDPWEMGRAYQIGRAKISRIATFMRRKVEGFAEAYVSVIAPLMGIRESRRVVGEYILTGEDHQSFRKFPDVVARNRYPVDIHLNKGLDYRKYPEGQWHDIPYRCLVVRGFSNLWVAGRCVSADFVAQSAIRIQPVCRALGEAAGVAASICARTGRKAGDLPYEELCPSLDLSLPEGTGAASGLK